MLAERHTEIPEQQHLVAPTLLRSQVLSMLYDGVRHGAISRKDAERRLDHVRGLRIRLLGDRVLQRVAWTIADKFGWPDTYLAEYIAVTQLQADAFITLDAGLARMLHGTVKIATIDDLLG
jgi:predicted nucleic acid-binding protein